MFQTRVHEVMQSPPAGIPAGAGIDRATQLLLAAGDTRSPVLSADGLVLGVVELRTLINPDAAMPSKRACPTDYIYVGDHRVRRAELLPRSPKTVLDVMSRAVQWTRPDATLAEAAIQMGRARTRMLLVLRNGRLLGTVSALDLLGHIISTDGRPPPPPR